MGSQNIHYLLQSFSGPKGVCRIKTYSHLAAPHLINDFGKLPGFYSIMVFKSKYNILFLQQGDKVFKDIHHSIWFRFIPRTVNHKAKELGFQSFSKFKVQV